MNTVRYNYTPFGYWVIVEGPDGETLQEYHATNNPLDSQGPVLAESGESLEQLKLWAEQTAWEIAEEWGTNVVIDETEEVE